MRIASHRMDSSGSSQDKCHLISTTNARCASYPHQFHLDPAQSHLALILLGGEEALPAHERGVRCVQEVSYTHPYELPGE